MHRDLAEQLLERRVVHINRVFVSHIDAHHTQCIERSGILAENKLAFVRTKPMDLGRIDFVASPIP